MVRKGNRLLESVSVTIQQAPQATLVRAVGDAGVVLAQSASGELKIASAAGSITIAASAARTASGNSGDVDVAIQKIAEITLDVTAVSGTTPVMNFYIEGKDQLSGKYRVIWSRMNINAALTDGVLITALAYRYIRARWVLTGTNPSFTFSCGGECKS